MANYSAVVDPSTDEDASVRNQYVLDVAQMGQTCTRAVRSFLGTTGGATQIADPSTGLAHIALWGDASSVKPAGTYVSTGVYDMIWPTSITDELGTSRTLNLYRANANVESSDGTARIATAKITNAYTVRVYTYEVVSGLLLPSQLAGQTITIFAV